MRKLLIPFILLTLCTFPCITASAQTPAQPKLDKASAGKIVQMLEESGAGYAKAGDNLWVAKFKGNQKTEIGVLVIGHESMLILSGVIVEKKEFKTSPESLMQLLRLNDQYDRVKVGIDDDGDVFVRIDLSLRVVDAKEFKDNLEQASAAIDEIYGAIKAHIIPAKK